MRNKFRQIRDKILGLNGRIRHEPAHSSTTIPQEPPSYDSLVGEPCQGAATGYMLDEDLQGPFEADSMPERMELCAASEPQEMDAGACNSPAELDDFPVRKDDRPQEAFAFTQPGLPGLPRKVPVRQPRYSEATSSSLDTFGGSSVFDNSWRRDTSTTQNTSIYSQGSLSELPGNIPHSVLEEKEETVDRRPQLTLDTGVNASNTLAVPAPFKGKGSAVSSASEISILTGEPMVVLESPDSFLPPNNGDVAKSEEPQEDANEISFDVPNPPPMIEDSLVECFSDKIVSPFNSTDEYRSNGDYNNQSMQESDSQLLCECHGRPILPPLRQELPVGFGSGDKQQRLLQSIPSKILIDMDSMLQATVKSSLEVAEISGVPSSLLEPVVALRPSLSNALSCLSFVQRNLLPFHTHEILSFLSFAFRVLDFWASPEQKQLCREIFFVEAQVWIEAINDPTAKDALGSFANIAWLPEAIENNCAHGHRWTCAMQKYCPISTLPFSTALEAQNASANSDSRYIIQLLQQSALTSVCVHFVQIMERADLIYRINPSDLTSEITSIMPAPGPSFLQSMCDNVIYKLSEAKHMAEFMPIITEAGHSLDNGHCPSLQSLCNQICHHAEYLVRSPGFRVSPLAYQPFIQRVLELQKRVRELEDVSPISTDKANVHLVVEWALQASKALNPEQPSFSNAEISEILGLQPANSTVPEPGVSEPKVALAPSGLKRPQSSRRRSSNLPQSALRRRRTRRTLSSDILSKSSVKCPICSQPFEGNDAKSNCKKHVNSVHANHQFDCCWENCTKHYNRYDNLSKHVREEHMPLLSHNTCLWRRCGVSFPTEKALKEHLKQHTAKPKAKSW
ncbi:MAG: hypothetical protein Q9227_000035 [Pyrenula ochraceoflavens]